jgi:hypothetical protein
MYDGSEDLVDGVESGGAAVNDGIEAVLGGAVVRAPDVEEEEFGGDEETFEEEFVAEAVRSPVVAPVLVLENDSFAIGRCGSCSSPDC